MGCLASQNKIEDRLTPLDYKIIWRKCLKVDSITISLHKRTDHPVFVQIAKDIDRTFPNHPYFQDTHNKKRFEKVLRKFALQFPKVGYTQGLNFITGFLMITGLTQQETIKTLIALLIHPELMLIGLYQDEFPLCKLYCELFWSLSKKVCPQGYKYLQAIGLPNQIWIFQWFITFFIYSFPISYIKDLLNFIVVKRYFAAVRLAVAIFYYLQKYVALSNTKEDAFLDCLQLMKTEQFCTKYLPIDSVIKKAQKIKKQMIIEYLKNSQQTSWYQQYFAQNTTNAQKKYTKFLEDSQKERQKFMAEQDVKYSGRVSRYIKIPQCMTIIDNIEDSVSKKFQKALYRSSLDKNVPFFSRLSSKNYKTVKVGTVEMGRKNTLK